MRPFYLAADGKIMAVAVKEGDNFDAGAPVALFQTNAREYFAAGYGTPLQLPVEIMPVVTKYLLPLLFLSGLGFTVYGLILRAKS